MYFPLISLSFTAYIQAFGELKMFPLSTRVAITFLDAEASVFLNLAAFITREGDREYLRLRTSHGLPETFGSKISSEIQRERPLNISCHCDSELTTASYYSFSTPLAQNSGALRSPNAGPEKRSQRRSQTLSARQEAARRKRPPLLSQLPTRQAWIPLGEDI